MQVGSAWVHQPGVAMTPFASHTWVEVSHCPAAAEAGGGPAGPAWKSSAMWLYAAAGSAVSVNIGRTLALGSFEVPLRHPLYPILDARYPTLDHLPPSCSVLLTPPQPHTPTQQHTYTSSPPRRPPSTCLRAPTARVRGRGASST